MAILLLVVVVVISAAAYTEQRKSLLRNVDNLLRSDAEVILALIESEDSLDEARNEIAAFLNPKTRPRDTIYRIWFEEERESFAASDGVQEWLSDALSSSSKVPSTEEYHFLNTENAQSHFRLMWAKLPDPRPNPTTRQPVNIAIAVTRGHVVSEMAVFLEVLLILGAITILGSVGLTFLILYWALRPIADLTAQMNDISAKNLEKLPANPPNSPNELRPFVDAWYRMLDRITLSMQQQRRFTADASHELRTPLTVAKSTLQVALSRKRSQDAYESAIKQSLEDLAKLQHLIDQLLELAHLDDISGLSNWEVIDLQDLVRDVCEQHLPVAKHEDGALKWQLCSAQVTGNSEQLRQLFANLIENAIKYGPGGGEVSVKMRRMDGLVNISVHDEGGNIPQEEQKNIFDRFYRIRKTRTRAVSGAGLGLALVREIAYRHRGSITVNSVPRSGTDFVVTLPQA